MKLAGLTVSGVSVGGMETSIRLRELGFCFDVGRADRDAVNCETVLFTHGHVDHFAGVFAHVAARGLRGMRPPTYVVPPHLAEPLHQLLELWRGIDRADLACKVVPLGPGEELVHRQNLRIRPFAVSHFGPAQGYGVWEVKRKLMPRYRELTHDEVRALRATGEEVTEPVETPLVAFSGDARSDVLDEPVMRSAKLAIFEVTFLDELVSVESARSKGHTHLDEVLERAEHFRNEAILMTHFSSRYNPERVRAILAERLPASLRARAVPFLDNFQQ
jgi:ribonuclease Z